MWLPALPSHHFCTKENMCGQFKRATRVLDDLVF